MTDLEKYDKFCKLLYYTVLLMIAAFFVTFLFLISSVHAASISSTLTAEGNGAIMVNQARTWESGDDLVNLTQNKVHTDGTAGHSIVTAPGGLQYQKRDLVDATQSNRYNSTVYAVYDSGGVTWDSLAMDAVIPQESPVECDAGNLEIQDTMYTVGSTPSHQYVDSDIVGMAGSAEYKAAKFVNDVDYTFSPQMQWEGAGLFTGNMFAGAQVGGDKNTTELNYETTAYDHFTFGTNQTGLMRVRPDWKWQDFSDTFVTNETNQTVNIT